MTPWIGDALGHMEYDPELRTIVRWILVEKLPLPDFIKLETQGLAKLRDGKVLVRRGAVRNEWKVI